MATEAKLFDLSTLESTDTADITLKHPVTGDDLDASVTVYSPDSEAFRAANTKMRAKITQFMSRNKGANDEQKQTAFDRIERERNLALIKSVNGLAVKGQPLTDVDEACRLYSWIYRQAVDAIDCASNFIKDSSATA